MNSIQFISHSSEQTQQLGYSLGQLAQQGDIFLLSGNLGSGKTCLTQGIARGMDIKSTVASPSFVLVREHYGRMPLYHIDLYRLDNIEEIVNLGLEQYFEGDGLCVVEWAEKGLAVFPLEHLLISLEYLTDNQRNISIHAEANRYLKMINELKGKLKDWNWQ
jgi:tRNA threonylcarbamoyladenosine biosynthesis protein TsaE